MAERQYAQILRPLSRTRRRNAGGSWLIRSYRGRWHDGASWHRTPAGEPQGVGQPRMWALFLRRRMKSAPVMEGMIAHKDTTGKTRAVDSQDSRLLADAPVSALCSVPAYPMYPHNLLQDPRSAFGIAWHSTV